MQIAILDGLSETIARTMAAGPAFPGLLAQWWQEAGQEIPGPLEALGLAALVLLLAYGLERAIRALGAGLTGMRAEATGPGAWVLGQVLAIALYAVMVHVLLALAARPDEMVDAMTRIGLLAALRLRFVLMLFELLGRQWAGGLSNPQAGIEAGRRYRAGVTVPVAVVVGLLALRGLLSMAIGPVDAVLMPALALTLAIWAAIFWALWQVRGLWEGLLREGLSPEQEPSPGVALIARSWYLVVGGFLVLSDAINFKAGLGLDGVGKRESFVGIMLLVLPAALMALRDWKRARLARTQGRSAALVEGLTALGRGVAVAALGAALLHAWGIDPFGEDPSRFDLAVGRGIVAFVTLLLGFALWQGLAALMDVYAPLRPEPGGIMSDEGPARGASRFETVYPVLRGALAALVLGVTGMLALSALGVAIGPLLAGAGVVGIAVGFGAQSIVRDIISGIFYLHEDAFRLGEYIESKEGKGVVEKISLRSVRLRHHRGPVYTIPFGTMGTIQNHSRDWVKVKFAIEVPASEDLEKVRKLVKKVGAALMEDPEVGHSFLEPLKSQGAVAMKGSVYSIGLKFTSRPGEQFGIRRKAYVALQRAFAENGIETARPVVVVASDHPLSEAEIAAAAGQGAAPAAPVTGA